MHDGLRNRTCDDLAACAGDTSIALSRIADDGLFFETKKEYGKDVVTGFLRLNGATVGAVANRTEVYNEEGEKTEEFLMELFLQEAQERQQIS